MSNVHRFLPKLTLNRSFVDSFLDATVPCCALGVIEERRQVLPLVALRPGVALPSNVTARGFDFGHSVLGNDCFEVVHFAFTFRGFGSYNVLVNPCDPVIREALRLLLENRAYFVLAIDPDEHVTAFRADVGDAQMTGLLEHRRRIAQSTTTASQYDQAFARFRRQPSPPGTMLAWVCREELAYLDLSQDRMELSPTPAPTDVAATGEEIGAQNGSDGLSIEPIYHPIDKLSAIAEIAAQELLGANDLYRSLSEARNCPHVMDDAEIARAIRLCEIRLNMVPVYREQAERWRCASPSRAQRTTLSLFDADIDDFEEVVLSTLVLTKEMAPNTIDAILCMDDGELGRAVFEGRRPPPSGSPLSEDFRVREYRPLAVMLDAVGTNTPPRVGPLEFLAAVAPQLPLFHRLMELCNEDEMNGLCAEYPGLYRFAKTMEHIATGIRSGAIPVPR